MPLPIHLAHHLTHRLSEVRRDGTLPWVRPDGKAQVTVEYSYGQPERIHTVLISTQHAPEVDNDTLRAGLIEHVINPVLPENWWMMNCDLSPIQQGDLWSADR